MTISTMGDVLVGAILCASILFFLCIVVLVVWRGSWRVFRKLRAACRSLRHMVSTHGRPVSSPPPVASRTIRLLGPGPSVLAVRRDGPDVEVRIHGVGLRTIVHPLERRWIEGLNRISCIATVRFIGCSRITSCYDRLGPTSNASRDLRLEPGWRLERLYFDGAVASMTVSWSESVGFEQEEDVPVTHELHCGGVRMTRRLDVFDSLFCLIFGGPHGTRVDREPARSPPIPGQDQEAFGGSRT